MDTPSVLPSSTNQPLTPVEATAPAAVPAEQQEKSLQLEMKALEVQEKRYQLTAGLKASSREAESRLTLDKLNCLEALLTSWSIDEAKSIIGSETVHKPTFTEEECWAIKAKIFELIKRL